MTQYFSRHPPARLQRCGRFRWLAYDVELGANNNCVNTDCFYFWWDVHTGQRGVPGRESRLAHNLATHPRFRQTFADHAWRLCFMPAELQFRTSDGVLRGNTPAGKAQARFAAAAAAFQTAQTCESLRWGIGHVGHSSTSPYASTAAAVAQATGTGTGTYPGGFFLARREVFRQQLITRGLYPPHPMPILTQIGASRWKLETPDITGAVTWFNTSTADPDPDGPLDTANGFAIPAGEFVELEDQPVIRARLRVPGFTTGAEDTAYWSALLDVDTHYEE